MKHQRLLELAGVQLDESQKLDTRDIGQLRRALLNAHGDIETVIEFLKKGILKPGSESGDISRFTKDLAKTAKELREAKDLLGNPADFETLLRN